MRRRANEIKLTRQLLVLRHPVFQKRTCKHQIVHLFWRTRHDHLQSRLGIVIPLFSTSTLGRLMRMCRDLFLRVIVGMRSRQLSASAVFGVFVKTRTSRVGMTPDVDEDIV